MKLKKVETRYVTLNHCNWCGISIHTKYLYVGITEYLNKGEWINSWCLRCGQNYLEGKL